MPGSLSAVIAAILCSCGIALGFGNLFVLDSEKIQATTRNDELCPGSPAYVHAQCEIKFDAQARCMDVYDEVVARVKGQYEEWYDPHNNGTYTILDKEARKSITLSRLTGNRKYTDLLRLHFGSNEDDSSCVVRTCSQSQVTSVLDFNTNYCNLFMLVCGADDGCKPVKHDIKIKQTEVVSSKGAGTDPKKCFLL